MLRRAFAAVSAAGLLTMGATTLVASVPAAAAPGGGACQLNGTANFTPNGPGATQTFGYSATGQLHDCQSNVTGAPTSGSLAVGQQVTLPTPNGPATYAEPLATGSGAVPVNSCPGGNTQGTGIADWPDGTRTVVDYTTSSVGPAVNLQGTVVASVTVTLVSGPVGSPPTQTLTTNNPSFPVGNGVQGAVAFTTNDPSPCTTAAGLSSVTLEGTIGIGSTG
jgi:hypothetical protein